MRNPWILVPLRIDRQRSMAASVVRLDGFLELVLGGRWRGFGWQRQARTLHQRQRCLELADASVRGEGRQRLPPGHDDPGARIRQWGPDRRRG